MSLPSEVEIHSLKSQEAKDLCIKLIDMLKAKQSDPISPGEVQLQELQYEEFKGVRPL